MKRISSCVVLILFYLVINASQRSVNFTTLEVSPYNVDNEWGKIEKVIQGAPVTELVFKSVLLCNEGLKKILNMRQVSGSIKSLQFDEVIINELLMETIWTHPRAQFLTNLTVKLASIEDDDLKKISLEKELNLQALSLQSGLISAKGFQHLSKLKFDKLQSLNIYDTSLTTQQAVTHFLKMNLKNLKQLNVGFTAISGGNLMKILNSLDLSKLTYLNISKNDLEADFYSNFSALNFSSLQTLGLSNLLIDEDGVKYLKNMSFPSLTTLDIGGNQFFVDGLYTFINKKNFPKLKKLSISENVFSTEFFAYLVKEFAQTKFQLLRFYGRGIEPEVFQHLKSLNFSQLKYFAVPVGFMKPEIVSGFFDAADFRQLEQLKIQLLVNQGNIFHKVMQKNWPNLKVLRIGRIGRVNFTRLQSECKQIRFPQLNNIAIDARSLNNSDIQKLLMLTSKTWVKQVQLDIIVRSPEKFIRSLAKGLLQGLDKQIFINLRAQKDDAITDVFKFMANPASMPSIRIFDHFQIIQQQFKNRHTEVNFQEFYSKPFDKFYNLENKEYFEKFDYSNIESLMDQKNCSLLNYLISNFQKSGKKCVINASKIHLIYVTSACYNLVNKCFFPQLHSLRIQFNNTFVSDYSNFTLFSQNMSQLRALIFQKQLSIPNQKIEEMFEKQNFTNLNGLVFVTSDMRSQNFEKIILQNPRLKRIRSFYALECFLQDLRFITDSNMKLKDLDLAAEMIGDKIQQLSKINFEFLKYFRLAGDGITNQNLLDFLSKLPKNQTFTFPRLEDLQLFKNYIETLGSQKLFEAGMPMLKKINMVFNKDPQIINTILGSQKSHRLSELALYQNDENSIDKDINVKNTRELKEITIQTSKLQQTDFNALSNMDFHSLEDLTVIFNQIFQCESLKHLNKIASTATKLTIQFMTNVGAVNSTCLTGQAKSDQNLKHLSQVIISADSGIYSNLRNYFDLLIFDQVLEKINIRGVYPTPQALRRLAVQANLDYAKNIFLGQNDLTDETVQEILNRNFNQLTLLQIGWNSALTSESIKYMRNRTYPSLTDLDISRTNINDTGLQIILSCKFPSLQDLDISNIEISGRLISNLSNLQAPNLNSLDLSSNNLKYEDLAKFSTVKFPYLKKIGLLPYLSSQSYQSLDEIYNKGRSKNNKITIVANILNIEGNQDQYKFEEISNLPDI